MKKDIQKIKKTAIEIADKAKEVVVKNPVNTGYVLGGLFAVYLLYKVTTAASTSINQILDGDKNIDDNVAGTGQGGLSNATITDAEAINFASQLLNASNAMYPLYGTDEDAIEKVFDRLKNPADFLKVFHAFGEKDYNGHNSPPTGIWSNLDSYKKHHLVYWLRSELDPISDFKVFNKVKKLVDKSGFTF